MKKKFVSTDNRLLNIQPNTQISFGTVSPFPSIGFPNNRVLFGAWYGNFPLRSAPSVAVGTLEVARRGDGTVLIDFDQYPLYSTGTPSLPEVVGPKKPNYHWSSDLPVHLKNQAPNWVTELIETEKINREE